MLSAVEPIISSPAVIRTVRKSKPSALSSRSLQRRNTWQSRSFKLMKAVLFPLCSNHYFAQLKMSPMIHRCEVHFMERSPVTENIPVIESSRWTEETSLRGSMSYTSYTHQMVRVSGKKRR